MPTSQDIGERVSSVAVAKEELWELAKDSEEFHRNRPSVSGMEAGLSLIAKRHGGNFEKAFAIFSRVSALARVLEEQGAPGWTLPATGDGGISNEAAIFAAAAVQPLIERDGELVFEHVRFFERVLELAEPAGTA